MKRKVVNKEIRTLIKAKGYCQWEAAEFLGFHESVFSRLLRKELAPEQKQEWMSKLQTLEERTF